MHDSAIPVKVFEDLVRHIVKWMEANRPLGADRQRTTQWVLSAAFSSVTSRFTPTKRTARRKKRRAGVRGGRYVSSGRQMAVTGLGGTLVGRVLEAMEPLSYTLTTKRLVGPRQRVSNEGDLQH